MPAEVQRTKYSNRGSQPEPLAETGQQCLSLPASARLLTSWERARWPTWPRRSGRADQRIRPARQRHLRAGGDSVVVFGFSNGQALVVEKRLNSALQPLHVLASLHDG